MEKTALQLAIHSDIYAKRLYSRQILSKSEKTIANFLQNLYNVLGFRPVCVLLHFTAKILQKQFEKAQKQNVAQLGRALNEQHGVL